jgi:hypothetical protein
MTDALPKLRLPGLSLGRVGPAFMDTVLSSDPSRLYVDGRAAESRLAILPVSSARSLRGWPMGTSKEVPSRGPRTRSPGVTGVPLREDHPPQSLADAAFPRPTPCSRMVARSSAGERPVPDVASEAIAHVPDQRPHEPGTNEYAPSEPLDACARKPRDKARHREERDFVNQVESGHLPLELTRVVDPPRERNPRSSQPRRK